MNKQEIIKRIELHKKWLNGSKDGVRANLSGADLSGSTLSHSNLE